MTNAPADQDRRERLVTVVTTSARSHPAFENIDDTDKLAEAIVSVAEKLDTFVLSGGAADK